VTLIRLEDVATFWGGSTPSRLNPAYFGGGIPWVKTTDLNNRTIVQTEETLTALGLKESSCRIVPEGAVLIAMYGGFNQIGRTGRLSVPSAVNQALTAVVPDPTRLDPAFLLEWLNFRVEHWKRLASSSRKDPNITKGDIADFPVPRMPLDQQHRVVRISSEWNVAIEKGERLVAAKELRFTALMTQLGVRRSRVDKAWLHTPLNQVADRVQRPSDGGDYPLLTISSASGFVRQEDKYSRYMAGESAKTYTLLRRGEFAYNKGNSLRYEFGCVFPLANYDAALVPSVYVSFRLREGISAAYMRHLFAGDYLKPQLRALVKTGVRNNGLLNIRPDEFMGTSIPIPPVAEQERIAAVLDNARDEIRLVGMKLDALRRQKRGLMQKLLTCQWRAPLPQPEAA
jgi:type I restriction enzyme S subunit